MNVALTLNTKSPFTAKQIFIDFLTYAKNPLYINEDLNLSKTEKFQYLFKVLLCKLALLPILGFIIYYTKKFTGTKSVGFEDTWSMFVFLVVGAPIIEETIFRGVLHYNRWSIALCVSFLLAVVIKYTGLNELIYLKMGFVYLITIVLFPVIYIVTKRFDGVFEVFWTKNFKYIFHFVAISFGLIHLSNYTGITNYLFALPLVTSQFISGYILGFVRMKLGFGYGVALHSAWNFVAGFGMLIVLLANIF
jgi:membrane protease YdiL (CAAX protease family)